MAKPVQKPPQKHDLDPAKSANLDSSDPCSEARQIKLRQGEMEELHLGGHGQSDLVVGADLHGQVR